MAMASALRTATRWGPPLVLMAVIFAFSALPSDVAERGFASVLARKMVHFAEYALLLALWWRALRSKLTPGLALGLAFALTVSYAVTDEVHQTYVDGRIGTPRDVAIDTLGAATSAALILRRRRGERSGVVSA